MRKSRLSQYKQNKLIELFVAGVTARTAAELVNVNKSTAAYYFHRLRLLIYQNSSHLEMFDGEVEADESYFGGHRKGKRGRGAADKVAVFGILKRGGKVYTVVIENAKRETLFPVITKKIMPDSIVYTDCLSSYDVLDVSGFIPVLKKAMGNQTLHRTVMGIDRNTGKITITPLYFPPAQVNKPKR